MKERTDRIAALVEKYLRKELSSEEQAELDVWLAEGNENKALFQQLTDEAQLLERLRLYDHVSGEAMWEKTMSKIEPGAKVVVVEFPKKKTGWLKYAAAAAVIVAVGAYLLTGEKTPDQTAKKQQQTVPVVDDEVVPGGNYAVLTKVDGSTVQLEKVADGKLGQEGPMSLTKTDGLLTYSGRFITSGPVSTGSEKHASLHNMVSTPRGGQYQITLPDGSRVWLNAASSLRFPLAFAGNQRVVELTGEAYFEVSKLKMPGGGRMPFIVKTNHAITKNYDIEVLGTHFSVMSYDDEAITTTLMEGSVRVSNGSKNKELIPGQKVLAQDGELNITSVDPESEALWKDGILAIEGDTKSVMNQIARWYNVEVVYDGPVPPLKKGDGFLGAITRDRKITEVIESLKTVGINARLERRKLIIKQ
jgi:ferric-dicitrate binding protein FerR (iron transport regulator)